MATIRVPPEIVDKALAVLVDESRGALAVWKGRGRIDLHDVSGSWHETSFPYPRQEEGLWSRDDVLRFVAEALASATPPPPGAATLGAAVTIDVTQLCRAELVRATALGYALWQGAETVDVFAADGVHLRSVRVPAGDLLTMSLLMHDLLEVCELMVTQHASRVAHTG